MKTNKRILLVAAGLAVASVAAYATGVVGSKTFRTTGYFLGITQGTDPVTSHPRFDQLNLAGHNLVNLAMGRNLTSTNVPSQVMAMTFECDLSAANLVVYDKHSSNIVATIAASTTVDSVKQQNTNLKGPNRAHFVALLQLGQNGNTTNGLAGGYLTIAGRVNLNPLTGCPEPVFFALDRDGLDRLDGNIELPAKDDPDSERLTVRAGLAHLIGVVDAITDGKTNTVLVPYGGLSIRRELPVITPAVN